MEEIPAKVSLLRSCPATRYLARKPATKGSRAQRRLEALFEGLGGSSKNAQQQSIHAHMMTLDISLGRNGCKIDTSDIRRLRAL